MVPLGPDFGIAQQFAIALLIGALVGTEREKKKAETQQPSFAGIRTFILVSEAGALSAWLSQQTGNGAIFAVAFIGFLCLVAAAYLVEKRANPASVGITTELAGLTVFLLGAAVMFGYAAIAVGLAVVNTSLLAFKDPLHGVVQKLGKDDIFAVLKLLIASFIVLPLLPHQAVDPWGALNPYKLWLLVVLISGLSLVGYVATRWLGSARGVAVTGLSGGLVSSTAVTLSMSHESRAAGARLDDAYAAGVLISWVVMFCRVLGIVAVFNFALLAPLLPSLLLMLALCAGAALVFYLRSVREGSNVSVPGVALKNPFSLWSAAKFGALFAVVLLLVEIARKSFSASSILYIAVFAGLTDVDAITLSMTDFARDASQLSLAATAVVAGVLANTAVKLGLTLAIGTRGMGLRMLGATGLMVAGGLLMLAWG